VLLPRPAKKLAAHLQSYSDGPSGDRWTSAPRETCHTTRYEVRAGKSQTLTSSAQNAHRSEQPLDLMHRCFQLHKGLRSRGSIKAAHAQGNPAGILHADPDAAAQRGQEVGVVVVHAGTKLAPAREVQMRLWLHS